MPVRIHSSHSKQRIAVIGTGAAGMGALCGMLTGTNDLEITVFDIGKETRPEPDPLELSTEGVSAFYDGVYESIRQLHPRKFPPPKTHFSEQIAREALGAGPTLHRSETFGGLTNYWGGTLLPFTQHEFSDWPISQEELAQGYQAIADSVGISGRQDGLSEYFEHEFFNRPALRPTSMLHHLDESVNGDQSHRDFKIVSGLNRCALETRSNEARSCVYCGECMAGCFRGSVYSTKRTIQEYFKDSRVVRRVEGRVIRISQDGRDIILDSGGTAEVERNFDKILLCAGCPATTEIVLRSLELSTSLTMNDNAVLVFPIVYLGSLPAGTRHEPYLALSNLILGCIPKQDSQHFAQVQVYPDFDYLWRYNVSNRLWKFIKPLHRLGRPRLAWGRLYLHSDYSQDYGLRLDNDRLVLERGRPAKRTEYVSELMKSIRSAVNRNGFYIPPVSPILQKTNSHYVGTLPFGGSRVSVSRDGEVLPDVYLCDSACFPSSPAVNPTFTIMANAFRTARRAIGQPLQVEVEQRSSVPLRTR